MPRNGHSDDSEERWNIRAADWDTYKNSSVWYNLPEDIDSRSCEQIVRDLYNRFEDASNEAIPKYKLGKLFPKPWWSHEVKTSKEKREHLYQKYRRNKTLTNLINWKRYRAKHKQLIKKH